MEDTRSGSDPVLTQPERGSRPLLLSYSARTGGVHLPQRLQQTEPNIALLAKFDPRASTPFAAFHRKLLSLGDIFWFQMHNAFVPVERRVTALLCLNFGD